VLDAKEPCMQALHADQPATEYWPTAQLAQELAPETG